MTAGPCRVLLVNPPYSKVTYEDIDRRAGLLQHPVLGLAVVAAPLLADGHEVRVADIDLESDPYEALARTLRVFRPDVVGVTGTTPMALEMAHIAAMARETRPDALIVAGGVHATTFPEETVRQWGFDVAVIGEGDYTLRDILRGRPLPEVDGIAYRSNGSVPRTPPRSLVRDLDELPMPAWQLFDIERYVHTSRLVERNSPAGPIETSRGCVFNCVYCNKSVFGRTYRVKSPTRVADEMERMASFGFRELHVEDDGFSTNLDNAKAVCDEILRRGIDMPWTLLNGIRVDRTDLELLRKLKQAGCYQVAFGVESGNEEILAEVQKGITKDAARRAFALAREAGLESFAFFMLGLPGDTESTMDETIAFAREIDADITKFAVTVPMPGTPMFEDYERRGLILTRDWSRYLFHGLKRPVYRHPTLRWETITRYYKKAYRRFYLRPRYVLRRLRTAIRNRGLLAHLRYAFSTRWW